MQILKTELEGVVIVEPKVFADSRGFFLETWSAERYAEAGLPAAMVQDNLSSSAQGVPRSLHYQYPEPQGKPVYVLAGAVLDVAVDIRIGSPTYAHWTSVELSAENKRQWFQGQRSLSRVPRNDFDEEVVVPSAAASLHSDAILARMLFQKG